MTSILRYLNPRRERMLRNRKQADLSGLPGFLGLPLSIILGILHIVAWPPGMFCYLHPPFPDFICFSSSALIWPSCCRVYSSELYIVVSSALHSLFSGGESDWAKFQSEIFVVSERIQAETGWSSVNVVERVLVWAWRYGPLVPFSSVIQVICLCSNPSS